MDNEAKLERLDQSDTKHFGQSDIKYFINRGK